MITHLFLFSIFLGVISGLSVAGIFALNPAFFSPSLKEMPLSTVLETVFLILLFVSVFSAIGLAENSGSKIVGQWILWGTLLICCWSDFKKKIIPNRVIYSGILACFGWMIYQQNIIFDGILSAFLFTVFVLVINYLTQLTSGREAFGMGDIKLFLFICLIYGWEAYWIIYLSVLFGGCFSIISLLTNQIKRGEHIPFAPFVLVGVTTGVYILPWQIITGWLYVL